MRDLKNNLTSGKNTRTTQNRKGKSFGYQVLGFGAGGGPGKIVAFPFNVDFLVVGGGGGGGANNGGGGGAGGFRNPTGVTISAKETVTITVGTGGPYAGTGTDSSYASPNLGTFAAARGGKGSNGNTPSAGTGGSGGGGGNGTP